MEKHVLCKALVPQFLLLVIILPSSCFAGKKPVLWNMEQLETIKNKGVESNLYINCIKDADEYTSKPFLAITNKEKSFAGDKHYYSSMAPYWWPDPNNPDGKYIRRDGIRNPEWNNYDNSILYSLGDKLKTLSIAYFFTKDNKYRDAYLTQLQVFFLEPETYMYPNFEYSQVVPGYNNNHGRGAGIIETESFFDLLDSYRLVYYTKHVDKKTDASFKEWFADFLEWMLKSDIGKEERAENGNISLYYDVLALDIASFVKNKAIIKELTKEFRTKRLDIQIMPDGSQPVELARTRGYYYSIYNLRHIVDFCIIQESLGKQYYKKNKDIINKAFAYLIQYIDNKDEFKYQQITSWKDCEDQLKHQILRLQRIRPKRNNAFDFSLYKDDLTYRNLSFVLE